MKRIITLSKTMMKSSGDTINFGKNKKINLIGLTIAFIYLAGFIGFISYALISTFDSYAQAGMSLYILLTGVTLYLLFMCFIMIPSIYYFSKDIQRYLVLPITAREFMIARFINTLVKLYASLALVYIPFGIAYTMVVGFSLPFFLFYVIVGLFVPLIPLIVSLIVVVVSFTFIPFFRNKNLFTYITSGLAIIFALAINLVSINSVDSEAMIQSLIQGLQTGTNTIVNLMNSVFPQVKFFVEALVYQNPLSLLIGIVISILVVVLALLLIQGLYIKSALSIQEESGSKKKLSTSKLEKSTRKTNRIWSLVKIDMKNILRTPIFAMNYFILLFLLPIIMIVPLFQDGALAGVQNMLQEVQSMIEAVPLIELMTYTICGSFLVSFFYGAFGMVASTAISREGQSMTQYKLMPMNLITLVNAKLLLSVLCMTLPLAIILIGLGIFIKINPVLLIISLICAILGSFVSNVFNILLDVYKPKLVWVQEQEAVKQNMLAMVPMITIMLLGALSFMAIIKTGEIMYTLVSFTILISILGIAAYMLIRGMCHKHLPDLIS